MKTWQDAFRAASISGVWAAALSTLALTVAGQLERSAPAAPNNAPSQWILGENAALERHPTLQHTLLGVGIHFSMSLFWAVLHERWIAPERDMHVRASIFGRGALTAALACLVDYSVTPRRFRPGFEKHLSRTALAAVYAAFGLGLAMPRLMHSHGASGARRGRSGAAARAATAPGNRTLRL
jgi:hypothetical protein